MYIVMWHDASGIARNLVGCTWLPWTTWMFFPFLEPFWKLDLWSHLETLTATYVSGCHQPPECLVLFLEPFWHPDLGSLLKNLLQQRQIQQFVKSGKETGCWSNAFTKVKKKLVGGQTLSRSHFYTTLHTTSLPNTFTKVKKKLVGGQTLSRSHFYTTLHTTSLPNQLLKHFWKQFPHMGKPFWNTYLNKLHFFVLWCHSGSSFHASV